MGCVQARPSMGSPSRGGGLGKMKVDHGYVSAGDGQPLVKKLVGEDTVRVRRHQQQQQHRSHQHHKQVVRFANEAGLGGSKRSDRDGGPENVLKRVEEGDAGVSQRITMPLPSVPSPPSPPMPPPQVGGGETEEMVDGWPRWLMDNIPREALVGFVPKSAESYKMIEKVGQGTYSNVYKARDRETGKLVALKKVRFETSESESVKFMAREIMILQKLDHPNVVRLEGLATSRMHQSLYLVFDFMYSDLAKIVSRPRLTEPQVKCYMQQLLSGLEHCHERGILHRDIKGSNLLIDKDGMLKIADFGLANFYNPNQKRPLTSRVVTLWYRAPELLLGATDYGVGIDLWSAGCLLAEMFAGRPIMPGRTEVEQLHRIFKLCGSPSEDYWRKLRLPSSLRLPQPYRPCIFEAFRDFPSSLGLLTTLLSLDPACRGTASAALQSEFFSTNPLACGLSGLPVIYKEESDESSQNRDRRRHKASKLKQRSRTQREGQGGNKVLEKPKGDSGSSKEEKISSEQTHNHELSSSTGTTSSSVNPEKQIASPPSPAQAAPLSIIERWPKMEYHHSATKNIKSPPQSPTSKPSSGDHRKDDDIMHRFGLDKRSTSLSDFRRLDVEEGESKCHPYIG